MTERLRRRNVAVAPDCGGTLRHRGDHAMDQDRTVKRAFNLALGVFLVFGVIHLVLACVVPYALLILPVCIVAAAFASRHHQWARIMVAVMSIVVMVLLSPILLSMAALLFFSLADAGTIYFIGWIV